MTSECPDEDVLIALALGELSDIENAPARHHVDQCEKCRAQVAQILALGRQVASEVAPTELTVEQITARAIGAERPRAFVPRWVMALAASAVMVISASLVLRSTELTARGGSTDWRTRLSAKVIATGSTNDHTPKTALFTVMISGLAPTDSLYVTAFVQDSRGELHWVAPVWVDASKTPAPVQIQNDQPSVTLSESVSFDDLSSGAGRAVTIVTRSPLALEAIERLEAFDERALRALAGEQAVIRLMPLTIDEARTP